MKDLEVNTMDRDKISYKDLYELIDRHIGVVNENIRETNLNVKETNNKLDKLSDKLEAVRIQTTKTNGRVYAIEQWECDVNKLIAELQKENKSQNLQLQVTSKDVAIITFKVAGILTAVGFIFYLVTGFVI